MLLFSVERALEEKVFTCFFAVLSSCALILIICHNKHKWQHETIPHKRRAFPSSHSINTKEGVDGGDRKVTRVERDRCKTEKGEFIACVQERRESCGKDSLATKFLTSSSYYYYNNNTNYYYNYYYKKWIY